MWVLFPEPVWRAAYPRGVVWQRLRPQLAAAGNPAANARCFRRLPAKAMLSLCEPAIFPTLEIVSGNVPDLPDVPGRSKVEIGAAIAKAGISAILVAGGAAAELFDLVIGPSLARRKDEWLNALAGVVDEIRERIDGFDPRNLEENEQFVSAVLAASTIAMRSHQSEKLESLRNALVNSVLPDAPDEHEQLMFLRLIDELTPLHIRMLAVLHDPVGWFDRHANLEKPSFGLSSSLAALIEAALPELRGRRDLYDGIGFDLDQRRLGVGGGSLHATMSANGAWSPRSTPFGQRFLAFFSPPDP